MDDRLTASSAATHAVRAVADVDRAGVSLRAGAIAAIPVAGVLAVGTLAGQPIAAVTMGAGAMLSGVAWRGGGGPLAPPIGTMVAAAFGLTVATLAGTLSGRLPWLHLVLLALVCLGAGLLNALGRRGGVVGVQTVIAFVVFGRFSEGPAGALTLAGLVLAGGTAQIVFAAVVARAPAWRRQRAAVADAYRSLAAFAAARDASNIPAALALDEAERLVSGPALFADRAAITLAGLVEEGRRLRLELSALRDFRQLRGVDDRLRETGEILKLISASLEARGDSAADLDAQAERLRARQLDTDPASTSPAGSPAQTMPPAIRARLATLAGQLRAAIRLSAESHRPLVRWHVAHPSRGSRLPLAHLPSDLRRLRASATLDSATGRHAVRLAVAVTFTALLVQQAPLPRGYWAVIATATVLRPEFGATFTRGAERLLGTTAGVVIATLIVVALQPTGWELVAIIALLAWVTYAVFPASFAVGTAGITALVVFLIHPVAPDSVTVALDRGIDTAIGGAIGVTVYMLWPTWSARSAERLLADVVDAQRRYLWGVLQPLIGGAVPDESKLRELARRARIAYSDAEAAVTLSRSEPLRGIDPHLASSTLVGLRRLVYAIHALRADLMTAPDRPRRPELSPLADATNEALAVIRGALQRPSGHGPPMSAEQSTLPPLRRLYERALDEIGGSSEEPLLAPLDELIDAVNTVASRLGLELQ